MLDAYKDSVANDVSHDITMDCVDALGKAHTLDATLGYEPTDPYAVTLTFYVPGDSVVWTISRELLAAGLQEPAGDGDVHVWPETDALGQPTVLIELCSPDGHLLASAATRDIRYFLGRSFTMVPEGTEVEHFDVDSLLSRLLAS